MKIYLTSTLARHKNYIVELENGEIVGITNSGFNDWHTTDGIRERVRTFVRVLNPKDNPEYFL